MPFLDAIGAFCGLVDDPTNYCCKQFNKNKRIFSPFPKVKIFERRSYPLNVCTSFLSFLLGTETHLII